MFGRKKTTGSTVTFADRRAQTKANKASLELGKRLRHLCKQTESDIARGEALEIIREHGHDKFVINAVGSSNGYFVSPIFCAVSSANRSEDHTLTHALMYAPSLDVNVKLHGGSTILVYALQPYIRLDHVLIETLLGYDDIDCTLKNEYGKNALFCATENSKLFRFIPMILDKIGDDVHDDAKRMIYTAHENHYESRTPLTNLVHAICDPEFETEDRKLLLNCIWRMANIKPKLKQKSKFKKARPNPIDESLLIAAKSGAMDVVEILLKAGADTNFRDKEARSAADLAKYGRHQEIASLINGWNTHPEQQQNQVHNNNIQNEGQEVSASPLHDDNNVKEDYKYASAPSQEQLDESEKNEVSDQYGSNIYQF